MNNDGGYEAAWPGGLLSESAGTHQRQIAYFISAHGLGHATRACAIMAAVHDREPGWHFHIFTEAPEWVFRESNTGPYTYHRAVTDVGLVQASPLVEDLAATLERLDSFLPFDQFLLRHWADWLARLQCELVVCDISPLGIAAARLAELPSLLIENFTWDWIYTAYLDQAPGLQRHIAYLADVFAQSSHRLQMAPVCTPSSAAAGTAPPVSRRPHISEGETRVRLGLAPTDRLILVTLSGAPELIRLSPERASDPGLVFIFPAAATSLRRAGQRLLLPAVSPIYHPDLVWACDAVINKLGYSTVAEAYHAGLPLGGVPRAKFPESPVMAAFVRENMPSVEIAPADFQSGNWARAVDDLLAMPRTRPHHPNGADGAADFIMGLL